MAHRTNIPENFEKKAELSTMLDDILSAIIIDAVFLSRKQREGDSEYHILTLFVDVDNGPVPNEIGALVSKHGKEHRYFRLRAYTQEQSEIGLSRGSLYFLEHCCLGEVVYARPGGGNLLDRPEMPLDQIIKRTERYHGCEMKKVGTFADTADMLIKEGDLAIATFNMHQAFELAFRFIEQMCIGHSRVTHSIIGHIKYCGQYLPTLVPFSSTSDMDNNELLLLLEHAYSVARYGNEFEITKAQAEAIQLELRGFIEELESIYRRHYDYCRDRIEGGYIDSSEEVEHEDDGNHDESLFDMKSNKKRLKTLEDIQQLRNNLSGLLGNKKSDDPNGNHVSFEVRDNDHLLMQIKSLLEVCVFALDGEGMPLSPANKNASKEDSVVQVLELVLSILPDGQMYFMDKLDEKLSELENKE